MNHNPIAIARAFAGPKTRVREVYGPVLQALAYSTGIMGAIAAIRRNEGAIILMYHSVADGAESTWVDSENRVPAGVFARQMEFLSRERRVVALGDLVSSLQEGETPPNGTTVITFDDGYLDNLTTAAPILERHGHPATLFLPVGYIDRAETQWVDQAYSAFKFRTRRKLTWGSEPAAVLDLADPGEQRAGYRMVCAELLGSSRDVRKSLLDELVDRLRPTVLPPRLTMTWDEIRSLLTKYPFFAVGGHTVEHTDLTSVSPAQAEEELRGCIERTENELGVRPEHFACCYGRTSETLRRLVAAVGYESACGGGGLDPVIGAQFDVFRLPRIEAPASMTRFDLLTNSANRGIWRRLGASADSAIPRAF